jgi:hypothetical protein
LASKKQASQKTLEQALREVTDKLPADVYFFAQFSGKVSGNESGTHIFGCEKESLPENV